MASPDPDPFKVLSSAPPHPDLMLKRSELSLRQSQVAVYAVTASGLLVITLFMALRLYTRWLVTKSMGSEDCESGCGERET